MRGGCVVVTGATGLVGGAVLERLLGDAPGWRAVVLLRDPGAWPRLAARLGAYAGRVQPVRGDVSLPGLGLDAAARRACARVTSLVVHCAADTRFSQTLAAGRSVNTGGTRNVLEFAAACRQLQRFVHVSTAFVAGRMTGVIPERALPGDAGWVNAYEQSKHEAEAAVRGAALPWVIARPATIVCDDTAGGVNQVNAVHRALWLYRSGLASMLPGDPATTVDLVTAEYVSRGIARLAGATGVEGGTYHLCAGAGAIPLGELLDRAHAYWSRDVRWRRRAVARPAVTSLATYRLFEAAVSETGDARLRAITRSLTHFVPQLALPKTFAAAAAEAVLGRTAPPVRDFLDAMLAGLSVARARSAA